MTDVKVGDRVRLTNKNGDVAEVTVKTLFPRSPKDPREIGSATNLYYLDDGWEVEILTPAVPTEPGWYESEDYPLSQTGYQPYQLRSNGEWYLGSARVGQAAMRHQGRLHRLVREGNAQ